MRRHVIFGTVSLGLLLSSISSQAISVALSLIIPDLKTSLIVAGWVLSGYSLVYTIAMPLGGKISEILSRRTAFITYVSLFTVGSVMCSLSPNIYFLICSRIVQAVGGGGLMPCAAGIVSDEFPEARQRYIGLFSSILPAGMIIGPNIGGWMAQAFGWRSIFWFNVPLGIIVIILSQMLLPTGEKKKAGQSVDFMGAGLLFSSLCAVMLGLTFLGKKTIGVPWIIIVGLFVLAVSVFVLFLRWERRVREPIIDLEILSRGPFLAANVYNIVYGICLGVLSLIPLFAVSVHKMSVLQSGLLLTPRSLGQIVASTITSFSMLRWGYRKPILAGTLMVALGFGLLSWQIQGTSVMGLNPGTTTALFAIVGLIGLGSGTCTPAASNACIELMPDKVATISGLRGMFRQMGSAMGVSLATMVINSISDTPRAFFIVMGASALLALSSIPAIFFMPASPEVKALK